LSLYEFIERPDLESPVLVLGLDGWIDAGLGGAQALAAILEQTDMETVATFDTDILLDHRARRPTMHLVDGVNTGLTWPVIELRAAADRTGEEALVLLGAEPDHNWRAFSRAVVDLALEFNTRLVVGLGAYPAPVPHTRPARVVSTATSRQLAEMVGFVHGHIDVPSGVHAAIERRCAEVGIPAVGLWAQVPHYAATMPYPAASAVLLDVLDNTIGVAFDSSKLASEAEQAERRLNELVANSEEHTEMVRQLEQHVDALEVEGQMLATGDELAAELERFLRDQGDQR
jgi:proteasome assembly chaperone (PAC2) family protein